MSDGGPDLSVVIVSYECVSELLALLGDLAQARSCVHLDVHVIDNHSLDGTADEVRTAHPWVHLTALDSNIGFGRANNIALPHMRAEFVLLLNPDTRVTPDALLACTDELRRTPDVGILTPRVLDEHGAFDRRCMRGFPTVWAVACHVSRLDRVIGGRRSRRYTLGWLPDDRAADVEAVSGAVMFCRTEALRQVGGFDERFFMYGEDIDLCLRVAGAGWRVRYWPGAVVTHLGGRSGTPPAARRAWARSIGDLHRIHRPGLRGRCAGALCDMAGGAIVHLSGRRSARQR